ncbi:MAG TPA: MFS transporter [Candidatus Saccharimonadales bacterium]|nr:MFS transporter [Candidatus Saccharimonadales bacterium]
MTGAIGARGSAARPGLLTSPLIAVCLVALLGFAANFVIQPVLPILILDLGGDATLVGIVIAAFSLPSVALRPVMGRLADTTGSRIVALAGVAVMAIAGFAYLIPILAVIIVVRVAHGVGWAAFNTGGHSLLARLAPPERRGEASGIYNLMPGIAMFLMPTIGLLLYGVWGTSAAFVASGLMALAACLVVLLGPVPAGRADGPRAETARGRDAWLEPGAVVPMSYEFLFSLSYSLFAIFPPVFAASRGIPVTELAIFYPIYGGTLVLVRALAGRFLDRAPRERVIAFGAITAIAGLAVAAAADTVLLLTVGGVLYAIAAAVTSPVTMAMAIDRSDPRRMGAAMATYTLGFQLAIGAGAALWGFLIDRLGYPAPYLVAIAFLCLLLFMLLVVQPHRRPAATHRIEP